MIDSNWSKETDERIYIQLEDLVIFHPDRNAFSGIWMCQNLLLNNKAHLELQFTLQIMIQLVTISHYYNVFFQWVCNILSKMIIFYNSWSSNCGFYVYCKYHFAISTHISIKGNAWLNSNWSVNLRYLSLQKMRIVLRYFQ